MSNPQIFIKMRLQFGELNITPRVVDRLHELDFNVPELEDAINDHKRPCDGEPSVYCGTYGKYNDGSLCGLWIDLSSVDDYDEFINFCKAIHADEDDPELMFQDYEGFLLRKRQADDPRQWYSESGVDEDDFEHIKEYCELCDKYDQDAVDDYMEFHDELDSFEVIAKRFAPQRTLLRSLGQRRRVFSHSVEAALRSPATSSRSATTLTGSWVISQTTSTTKPSHATCSCTTTRWAQTTTCFAWSDPLSPSLLPSRVALLQGGS